MCDVEGFLENKQVDKMLEFENQIFLDVLHTDCLVVTAKGLNLNVVLSNLFRVYCDPGNLILVLNSVDGEQNYYASKLNNKDVYITSPTNVEERENTYLLGGIHFVSTRILVVDMLKNRIPIEKITGFIVFRAHSVMESCQEAFVLRLYRQKNKTGFIKAFSSSVQSFTFGFGHVERVMKSLFVKELNIWPRFHSIVLQSLQKNQPQVIELHIPISSTMSKIQTCILDLMNLTVKELKRINKTIELQEITVENCLTKQFHKILQAQLNCIWNQLSVKSRQLVADLRILRHLILLMLYSDPVTFYANVCCYRTIEYVQTSTWVLLEPAELLFTYSGTLVFSGNRELNPQFCPKWNPLLEILKVEVPAEIKKSKNKNHKVLILCQDTKICYQLNHVLTMGPRHYLFQMTLKHGIQFNSINSEFNELEKLPEFSQTRNIKANSTSPKKAKLQPKDTEITEELNPYEDDLEDLRSSYCISMTQSKLEEITTSNPVEESSSEQSSQFIFEPFTQMENLNITQLCEAASETSDLTIFIQTLKKNDDSLDLLSTLEEMQPNFIIMYHTDITAIRNIELYEAHREDAEPLKVFFLIHAETVEEQSYLTTLRREKEAFEFLIETKSTMVVPEDQDGKSENCIALQRNLTVEEINTRHGGAPTEMNTKPIIIVDMREFSSELPALIHKRGIEIEPVTIAVGDYIITPDICIERKTLSDLIGSLNSGRLYKQCTQMGRYYSKPMLLIEFDQNKPFTWQNNYMISKDEDSFDVQQKLILLTLHFPKLKIVWSASPYASAQLFEELKAGKQEPNIQYAVAIGNEQELDIIETKYNSSIYDFIQKLPGITSKNIDSFLRQCNNLDSVIEKTEEELQKILGNAKDAKAFYSILHEIQNAQQNPEQRRRKIRQLEKFKTCKK